MTGHEWRTWLGSWATSLIHSSNSPPDAFWGEWTLWVPCQLPKTKIDPRTAGYFWMLDRITAGDTSLACPSLKERDCIIWCGLLHHIIHKRPLKRPAPLKVFFHSSWVFSLIKALLKRDSKLLLMVFLLPVSSKQDFTNFRRGQSLRWGHPCVWWWQQW